MIDVDYGAPPAASVEARGDERMAFPYDLSDVVNVEETNGGGFWLTVWSPNGDPHLIAYMADEAQAEHAASVLRGVLVEWEGQK